jgi:hypothetical protein
MSSVMVPKCTPYVFRQRPLSKRTLLRGSSLSCLFLQHPSSIVMSKNSKMNMSEKTYCLAAKIIASFLFCRLSCLFSGVSSQTAAPVPGDGVPIVRFGSTLPLPLAADGIGPVPFQIGVSFEGEFSWILDCSWNRSIKDGGFCGCCFCVEVSGDAVVAVVEGGNARRYAAGGCGW